MSGLIERLGIGKQQDNFDDDFIYFWDDVDESDFITLENKTFGEWISENTALTLHFLMFIPVLIMALIVISVNLFLGIALGFLSAGLILISYYLSRNEFAQPMKILAENFKEIQENDLGGTDELLYSLETSELLTEFNKIRMGFSNFMQLHNDNTRQLRQEVSLLQTMITNTYRETDRISINLENSGASAAHYQELRNHISRLSSGLDLYTENFDISFSSINEITNTLKSIGKQTTMLALNAGIEAAKAGSRGKGFEVVASNLRRLAQHAIDTANRVKASSEQVKENARRALEDITNGTSMVEQAVDRNHQNMSEVNMDLYHTVNDINTIRSGYQRVLGIIERQEEDLSKYKY